MKRYAGLHYNGVEVRIKNRAITKSKTLQAGATCYVHNANKYKGFNALIMSPSHLVEKWKSEMETYIPNAKGYIIHNLDELLALENKLRAKNRVENVYVIMSKEIAKLGFDLRPAAIS